MRVTREQVLAFRARDLRLLSTLSYLEFLDADKLVQEDYAKAEANEMSARDLAARAQKVFEDAKIGTQGL